MSEKCLWALKTSQDIILFGMLEQKQADVIQVVHTLKLWRDVLLLTAYLHMFPLSPLWSYHLSSVYK